jgi:DNA-binding transcriptional regulator PaaX
MNYSEGPCLRLALAFALGRAVEQLSATALVALWKAWTGETRVQRALAHLEQQGMVRRLQGGTRVDSRVYELTDHGRALAAGGRFPPERWARSWDGRWRMLAFDIPQRDVALRVRLRREMIALGFGALQRSLWLSPDSFDALQSKHTTLQRQLGSLALFESRPAGGTTDEALVAAAWDFAAINHGYSDHQKILEARPGLSGVGAVAMRSAWRKWLSAEMTAWNAAVKQDPLLPEALLPPGYRGRESWERRLEVLQALPALD